MKSKPMVINALVLGLALFAMFFGAGNLIFPPLIGLEGGTDWGVGFVTYFIADVGLAMVSILAMLKADGDMNGVTGSIGKVPSVVLNTVILLCIGPMLAIPRTATTSFEMGAAALFGGAANSQVALFVFSAVFLAIVFLLAMSPGKVVGYVGKILTPVLVVTLAVLIIAGIAHPSAAAAQATVSNLVEEGILNGYQTMDVIAALAFSIIAVQTVKGFGYTDKKQSNTTLTIACVVSSVLLMLVYGGLAYLGATTGQLWSAEVADGTLNQAGLLANITSSILGDVGAIFLAAIVLFACLTTSIGLVSSCSEYFHNLTGGKISYKAIAAIICVVSLVISNVGLTQIISISAPILSLVYPVAMFLVVAHLCRRGTGGALACKCGAVVALLVSLLCLLDGTFGVPGLSFVHALPLDNFGLGWVLPTVIAALVGLFLERPLQWRSE